VMHQVNSGNHLYAARNEALELCSRLRVGVVAMKPFAGGELLRAGQRVNIPAYKTGWKSMSLKVPGSTTSTKLLNYVLEQPAVCTVVTGVSSTSELSANLAYFAASADEKDHAQIIVEFEKSHEYHARPG